MVALTKKKCINESMKCVIDDQSKNIYSLLDSVWPIGSIYLSVDATNPSEKLGGTWEVFAQGQMLLGFSATHDIGSTGGEETHALTTDEMPRHRHSYTDRYKSYYSTYKCERAGVRPLSGYSVPSSTVNSSENTGYKGDGAAHNNMPPFITVGIWRRIA